MYTLTNFNRVNLRCTCVRCTCVLSCSVMSNSLRPQDCSLPGPFHPWDFPGRNTGVGCHALFQGSSWPRDGTHISCTSRWTLYHRATPKALCKQHPDKKNRRTLEGTLSYPPSHYLSLHYPFSPPLPLSWFLFSLFLSFIKLKSCSIYLSLASFTQHCLCEIHLFCGM